MIARNDGKALDRSHSRWVSRFVEGYDGNRGAADVGR